MATNDSTIDGSATDTKRCLLVSATTALLLFFCLLLVAAPSLGAKPKVGHYALEVGGLSKKYYAELLTRWKVEGTDQKIYFAEDEENEGDRYQWEVYVPESYDGTIPHGAIVYINSDDGGRLFNEWKPVLEKHNLIWILGFKAGNEVDPVFRHAMALEGVNQLRKRYNIDSDRIYLSGISGGGRAAGILMLMFPDVFDGGWTICGINPIRKDVTPKQLQAAKTRNRYVFMTGDDDFNRDQVKLIFDEYQSKGFAHTKYIQVAGMDHAQPRDAKWVEQAIAFLDGPLTAEAKNHFSKAEGYYTRNKYARALVGFRKAAAHGGEGKFVETAKERLAELNAKYREEFSRLNNKVETGDLRDASKQLNKFRKRWSGATGRDFKTLTITLKRYRKEGRPERTALKETDVVEEEQEKTAEQAPSATETASSSTDEATPEVQEPNQEKLDASGFPSHPFKFTAEAALEAFTLDGGHQFVPGQGIRLYPGEPSSATSKAKYKFPMKLDVMVAGIPNATRDIAIQFAGAEFVWGEHSNSQSAIYYDGERTEVKHIPIQPQQLGVVSLQFHADRTFAVEVQGQEVYRGVVPTKTSLEGSVVLKGTGHILYHGIVISAEEVKAE